MTGTKINRRKLSIKEQYKRDHQPVTGIFRFDELKGGFLKFCFKKHKEDPIETYEFYDGNKYTIPRMVAMHLNKNVWYPVHAYNMDEAGVPTKAMGKKVDRCSFQSLEFTMEDDDGLNPSVIEEVFEMKP